MRTLAQTQVLQAPLSRVGGIRVDVMYFAQMREVAGLQSESVELVSGSRAKDVISTALKLHPRMASVAKQMRVLVNNKLVDLDHSILEGDSVALLTPSCGG